MMPKGGHGTSVVYPTCFGEAHLRTLIMFSVCGYAGAHTHTKLSYLT
jgi:hypothetical protein